VRRHPLLTAGLVAIRLLRRPDAALGWFGSLMRLGPVLLSAWKLFARQ
jgi:hypothetical protein